MPRMYCSHIWIIVLPLDIPDLTTSLLLWGPSSQRWGCLWTFLFLNVPTFASSCLQEILAAKGGTTWGRNGRWILPENARLPRNIQGSFHAVNLRHGTDGFTSPPKEGVLRIFSPWKIQWLRSGLNPRTWEFAVLSVTTLFRPSLPARMSLITALFSTPMEIYFFFL